MRTLLVLLLSLAPICVVVVHQRALKRQYDVLQGLPAPLRATLMWRNAGDYFGRRIYTVRSSGRDDAERSKFAYWFSLSLVWFIVFASWNFTLDAPFGSAPFVDTPNILLLGPITPIPPKTIPDFQRETLAITCIAFVVAYTSVVFKMAVRLNTNNFSATQHLFDAVQLSSAILVADIGRIALATLGAGPTWATMFAIVAGLRPDFWLGALGRSAALFLTQPRGPFAHLRTPERQPLAADKLPPEIQLQSIDGVDDEAADRLRQIDISTCHQLAFHNVFVIWIRTSFGLHEVTDWFGQALLVLHFPKQTARLRGVGVRTIMDLVARIEDHSAAVVAAIGVDAPEARRIVTALRQVPQVRETCQLSNALLSQSAIEHAGDRNNAAAGTHQG